MKTLLIAATAAAVTVPLAAARRRPVGQLQSRVARVQPRAAPLHSRGEYRSELRECRRELNRAQRQDYRLYSRYDCNRNEPGYDR